MPELPDVEAYLHALRPRVLEQRMEGIRLQSPFLLRTVTPKLEDAVGRRVVELRRIGKRLAFGLENELWLVLHLMIAGRLHWKEPHAVLGRKGTLLGIDFEHGTLTLTEAGSKRRASLYVVAGEQGLQALDPGGLDVLTCSYEAFRSVLTEENHTLKRALTDPRVLSGVGNAYSDEILHAAGLSPMLQTQKLTSAQWQALYSATRKVLAEWCARLNAEADKKFPEKVTAFRPEMNVHGRFGQACRVCGGPVQRIRYADNETNYCATCQNGGKLLADRGLSRLLGKDWPKTLDELETLKRERRG